ncbi:MAG: phage integrase SAM-like domain-containing protein [Prevotella sp.]|nr:phage integrase SAM-like domain-containing protein [Prevotella sp.]MCF0209211.1 phage integrase SAM-like domain-containing protein [Bacteroidaceae bacterium]
MKNLTKKPKVTLIYDRKHAASETKPGYVEIQVYYDAQRQRIATGIGVMPSQWVNDCVVNHPESLQLNQLLYSEVEEVNRMIAKQYAEGKGYDLNIFKGFSFVARQREQNKLHEQATKAGETDFFFWLNDQIQKHPVKRSTKMQHIVMMAKLKEFGGIKRFADLTTANIKKWDIWLHQLRTETQTISKQTTIHGYHKRFKVYVRMALEFGLIEKNPYDAIHISHGKSEDRKFLSSEERDAIEALQLTGSECIARDLFIFACYTGLAFSDVAKIKKEDVKKSGDVYYIQDERTKTR